MKKRIALVHPTINIPFIFESAAKNNIELVLILPHNEELTIQYSAVKDFANLPIYEDPETALDMLPKLYEKWGFDGIMAVKEPSVVWTAAASAKLGLKGISIDSAIAARDKSIMRKLFKDNGLRVPENITVSGYEDLNIEDFHLNFPCIVKPSSGYNSAGVQLVYDFAQLEQAINHIKILNKETYEKHSWSYLGNFSKILIEEFISGPEYVVELFGVNGNIQALNCGFKDCLSGPYFEETFYISPPPISLELLNKIKQTAIQGMKALNLTDGPGHCELRLNQHEEPIILEIGARIGGAGCAHFNVESSIGIDFAKLQFDWVLNNIDEDNLLPQVTSSQASSSWILPLNGSGHLVKIDGLDEVTRHPDFCRIINFAKLGKYYRPYPAFDGFLAIIFAKHKSTQGGLEFFEFLKNTIKVIWKN